MAIADFASEIFAKVASWAAGLLPDWLGNGYDAIAAAMGPSAQYFAYVLGLDVVAPTIVSAYVVKFLIRRLPIIG